MRMVPRRSLSLAFIAVFMSSVMRSLSEDMAAKEIGEREKSTGTEREAPSREQLDQYARTRVGPRLLLSRVTRFMWRFTAAAFLRLRS